MSAARPRPTSAFAPTHPAVVHRRIHELFLTGLAALVAAVLALAVIVALPDASVTNVLLVLGGIVGVIGVAALVVSSRLELTVTLLTLYLLLLYGPIKLGLGGGTVAHGADTVLILAICLGALLRFAVRQEPVKLPPLSAWVLAYTATVVIEAFNPKTGGVLKVLGGFRQGLQWVPFFFFGYQLIRSKKRLRQLFLLIGVCALANGIVASYQTGLSPQQIASWGPGYRELFQPTTVGQKGGHARVYDDAEGQAHPRPVGLGSDSGFSGGIGLVALPFCLALLATWRSRRRWIGAVLALGALMGVLSGLGRLQVIGAVLSVLSFLALASLGGRRFKQPLIALLTVAALAVPLGVLFLGVFRSGTFSRYTTFEKASPTAIATHKAPAYQKIPEFLQRAPFGIGLGTTGPAGGFGGQSSEQGQGHGASAETQYNFISDELGAPGLLVWVALSLYVVLLIPRRLRDIHDGELAILLSGLFAPFAALIIIGFSGPIQTSAALGPYFWFAVGAAAYWLVGPGRPSQARASAQAQAVEGAAA